MITVPLYPLLTNVIFLAEKDTQCPIPVPLDILRMAEILPFGTRVYTLWFIVI